MDQGTKVGAVLVLGLVGGYVIAKLTAPSPSTDCTTPQSRTINVRANSTVDCPEAWIGTPNTITWLAPAGTRLMIAFGPTTPFRELKCFGSNRCESYGVDPNVFAPNDPTGTKKTFPYTVSLNGGPPQPNGRIIIEK